MIEIRNIYITEKGDKLVIDANIVNDNLFKDCYIKKIYIDTQRTYTMTGPSEDLAYELDITEVDANKFVRDSVIELNGVKRVKNIRVVIPEEDICANLKSDFFVVYIQSDGDFDKSKISKCCSPTLVVGCAFWMQPLYRDFLSFIRELNISCDVPRNFIYKYLQFQALLVAARTGNINEAIFFFERYIRHVHYNHHNHHVHTCVHCSHDDHDKGHHNHHEHIGQNHHKHDNDKYYQGFEPHNFIHVEHYNCNCHGGDNFLRH